MTTATQLIKRALQRILVQESEGALEPDEYQDALDSLNGLMAAWEADGIRLGYTEVTSLADTITVAPGAIRGIVANLAIEVAPDYDGTVTPELYKQADEGEKVCRKLGITIQPTQLPDNLPKGSGNDAWPRSEEFYDEYNTDGTYFGFKDPDSVEDFFINWADLLDRIGETISASSWAADESIVIDSDTNTTTTATAVISGGDLGGIYRATNTITTSGGGTYERTWVIKIREA